MGVWEAMPLYSPIPKGNAASPKSAVHDFSEVAQQFGGGIWIVFFDGRDGKLCEGVAPLEGDREMVALISNSMDLSPSVIQGTLKRSHSPVAPNGVVTSKTPCLKM